MIPAIEVPSAPSLLEALVERFKRIRAGDSTVVGRRFRGPYTKTMGYYEIVGKTDEWLIVNYNSPITRYQRNGLFMPIVEFNHNKHYEWL